jgi:hypothetical protein
MRSKDRRPEGAEGEDDADAPEGIAWPLGLRILPPGPQSRELRSEIEARVKQALRQADSGRVDRKLLAKVRRDLDKLDRLLAEHADTLTVSQFTLKEAARFLKELKDWCRTWKGGSPDDTSSPRISCGAP